MPICLEVDAYVIVLCLFVEVFDSCGCEERFHAKGLLEVFGRGVVGVVGLNEANGGFSRNIQQKDFRFIEFVSLDLELFGDPVEEFSQDCSCSISINEVQFSICLCTKLSDSILENYPIGVTIEGKVRIVILSLEVSGQYLFGLHMISSTIFVQELILAGVG